MNLRTEQLDKSVLYSGLLFHTAPFFTIIKSIGWQQNEQIRRTQVAFRAPLHHFGWKIYEESEIQNK